MGLNRMALSVEALDERIVPDATPAPPLLTFQQTEQALVSEQAELGEVEANIKQGTDALAGTPAAAAYWVPKLSQLASGWVLLQSDYAAARGAYTASAAQAEHDIPQGIAGFQPHGAEAVFGTVPVNGAVTIPSAGTTPVSIPVPPPFPRPSYLPDRPEPVEIAPSPREVLPVAPSPRELSPERALQYLVEQTFRQIGEKLSEMQMQLAQLETDIGSTIEQAKDAARGGNVALQQFLNAKLANLLIQRELLRKAYNLARDDYMRIADGLGYKVPDTIRNFDPLNPGFYA